MKTFLKFLMPTLLMIAFASAIVPQVSAQDPVAEQQAVYQKFLDNRKGPELEKFKIAVAAGDEFIQKYGSNPDSKEIVDYINKILPKLKEYVRGEELAAGFNQGVIGKNWDSVFSNGKQLIAANPDNLDVLLIMASIGYDRAFENPPVDKYNDDTIQYSKLAIEKLNANKASATGKYGAFDIYEYKNKDFADGKANALGWMNYNIGYIMYNRKNQKKDALPYLYKATQANSATKNFPQIYQMIGAWYVDEFNRVGAERKAKVDANNGEDTEETKTLFGLQRAYAERAMEAYARAYKVAPATAEGKAYRDSMLTRAKELYKIRFDKTDGADAYIAGLGTKTFTDPSVAVVPVVETVPTPTTASTPTASTGQAVAPVAQTTVSTTTTTVKTPAAVTTSKTTTTTTTKTTPVKKTATTAVTKKKGTR